jgi:hypothetical protein
MSLFRRRKAGVDDAAWAIHEQRAGTLVAEALALPVNLPGREIARARQAWVDRVFSSSPEVAGSVLMLLVRASGSTRLPWAVTVGVSDLARRQWAVSRADAFLALRTATGCADDWHAEWVFKVSEALLRRTASESALNRDETEIVRAAIASLESRRHLQASDRRGVRTRLVRLLPDAEPGIIDTTAIVFSDGWSATVLPDLATSSRPDEVSALLRHLAAATGSKPAAKWLAVTAELLADDEVTRVIRVLIERLVTADPVSRDSRYGGRVPIILDEQNADIARAAVWAASPIDQPWVVPTLHRLADLGIRQSGLVGWLSGDKVLNAAILVLGRRATPDAVAALQQLAGSTKHNGIRKRIAAALATAAEAAGLTPSQLVERNVPTGGLDQTGTATFTAGTVTARASIDNRLKVATEWQGATGWARRPPADAVAADVSHVKREVKELRDVLGVERRRVEGLFATDRSWDIGEWRRYYLEHPVAGLLAHQLIWTFDSSSGRLTGLPVDAGTVRTINGDAPLPDAATVRLWHPATASTDEVSRWRDWMLREKFVQPFKQAFREVYLLTPAELTTATYSNRFAAHVLRYQQLYALFKERLWVANYLGPYDGGYDGRARHEFPDAGLTAVFEHFQIEAAAGEFRPELCSTDRVWFFNTSDRAKTAVALDQVPPLVFSEAMRDIDLFVGVTSIALDPNWGDRGDDPHYDYWLTTSFGALTATAEIRRDVLATLLPKLKVADRVELSDRFVRVRGTKATYKVHLGSANIQIEPDDRYLCIVPNSNGRTKRVMLPFEGDEVLTVVLSKVLMLADDDKITDPTILRQINPRS